MVVATVMALRSRDHVGVIIVIAVGVEVAAAGGEGKVARRGGQGGVEELRMEGGAGEDGEGGTALQDPGSGEGPATERTALEAVAEMAAGQLVGRAQRKPVAYVIGRAGVVLVEGVGGRVVLPVVQRMPERVRGRQKAAPGKAAAAGGDETVVVRDRGVERIVDVAEAGVQPGLGAGAGVHRRGHSGSRSLGAADVLNQVAGKDVDVVAVRRVSGVSTGGDQASGVGADVPNADDEAGGDLAVDGEIEVDGEGTAETGVDPADADLAAYDASFGVERLPAECRVGVAEWICVLGSVAEDRGGGGSVVIERRPGEVRWIAAKSVFRVAQREVVVKEADAPVHEPLVVVAGGVREAAARAEDPVQVMVVDVTLGGDDAIGHLILKGRAGAQVEVRKAGTGKGGIGVAEVIVADTVVDGEFGRNLPGVLDEGAAGGLGVAVVVGLRLAGEGIVGETALGVGIVVDQVDEAVELERRLGVSRSEECDVIAMPAFVTGTDGVRSVDVGEDVAPVVAVLDVIAQGEARSEADAESGDIDDGNGEVAA